jgi:hypothetical protein
MLALFAVVLSTALAESRSSAASKIAGRYQVGSFPPEEHRVTFVARVLSAEPEEQTGYTKFLRVERIDANGGPQEEILLRHRLALPAQEAYDRMQAFAAPGEDLGMFYSVGDLVLVIGVPLTESEFDESGFPADFLEEERPSLSEARVFPSLVLHASPQTVEDIDGSDVYLLVARSTRLAQPNLTQRIVRNFSFEFDARDRSELEALRRQENEDRDKAFSASTDAHDLDKRRETIDNYYRWAREDLADRHRERYRSVIAELNRVGVAEDARLELALLNLAVASKDPGVVQSGESDAATIAPILQEIVAATLETLEAPKSFFRDQRFRRLNFSVLPPGSLDAQLAEIYDAANLYGYRAGDQGLRNLLDSVHIEPDPEVGFNEAPQARSGYYLIAHLSGEEWLIQKLQSLHRVHQADRTGREADFIDMVNNYVSGL